MEFIKPSETENSVLSNWDTLTEMIVHVSEHFLGTNAPSPAQKQTAQRTAADPNPHQSTLASLLLCPISKICFPTLGEEMEQMEIEMPHQQDGHIGDQPLRLQRPIKRSSNGLKNCEILENTNSAKFRPL